MHDAGHGVLVRHEQQVIVVPQKAVRQTVDSESFQGSFESPEKSEVVGFVLEDALFVVSAGEHVARHAGEVKT
jgi:hypothetical protein